MKLGMPFGFIITASRATPLNRLRMGPGLPISTFTYFHKVQFCRRLDVNGGVPGRSVHVAGSLVVRSVGPGLHPSAEATSAFEPVNGILYKRK